MNKYDIMTPEIEAIDNEITRLITLRCSMVAKAAKKKADALCAEMAAKKARRQGGASQGFGGPAGAQSAGDERSVAARNMALAKPAFRKASKRG
jgi:hypothetical protein